MEIFIFYSVFLYCDLKYSALEAVSACVSV